MAIPVSRVVTAVVGGIVVDESGTAAASVLIDEDGRIAGLVAPGHEPDGCVSVDAAGLHVFPGAVDPHTHLNDPGSTESEDFHSGTCGAAAGGITTVVEMPQTVPIVDDEDPFREKLGIARSKAIVDFALYGALTADNVRPGASAALERMARAGAIAFKAFTTDSPEQPHIPDDLLIEGMEQADRLKLPVVVHSEYRELIDFNTTRLKGMGRNDPLVNPDARPPLVEIEAVRRVLALAGLADARVHIAHASHPTTFHLVGDARARGVRATVETCAHYLMLTRDDVAGVGAYAMCNPPLREKAESDALWPLLERGGIDAVGSDHCAYTVEEKANPDYWETPAGISGIQLMFPMIAGEVSARGLDLRLLPRLFSANPARLFGMFPRKGALKVGSDADLVLLDLESPWRVKGEELFSKAPGTAFEGRTVKARVLRTMVRGRTVFVAEGPASGRIEVDPGYGCFLPGPASLGGEKARLPA